MSRSSKTAMVFIIDFGSQYSQLIARRVRALGVAAELRASTAPISQLKRARAIILSGGPDSVYAPRAPRLPRGVFALGVPVLGICYGMQLLAHELGGSVERAEKREYGPASLTISNHATLFSGLGKTSAVWMSHGDLVTKLPRGFVRLAHTANSPDAAIADPKRRIYGVQFHPEVEHTRNGMAMLANFLFRIAGCKKDWDVGNRIERKVRDIRETVGDARIFVAVSGGVDSTVTAALVSRAVGKELTAVFVNHGLLRKGEPEEVAKILKTFPCRSVIVNAQAQFLKKLRGVEFGERKRKIIGAEFVRVFDQTVRKLRPRPAFFAQGTIHSDVIESAQANSGTRAQLIKSHHNVGGLPKGIRWKLVEPLRDLFKDEVRELGEGLGLPKELVWRQPFPGPGLAIRIAGEVTTEKLRILREADAIVQQEVKKAGWEFEFYHYFAQLLSQKTVGVTGDERNYAYPIVVRIVRSSDIMTADWAKMPNEFLAKLSWRITNEVRGAVRVLYDITSKPPGTVEWE